MVGLVAEIVERVRGRPPRQPPAVSWYASSAGRSTIRETPHGLRLRLSVDLKGAAEPVLRGVVGILVCRMYGFPTSLVPPAFVRAYREHMDLAQELAAAAPQPGRRKGRKHIDPVGAHRSLLESYLRVTMDMGLAVPVAPKLSWSQRVAGHRFGHWDPEHQVIVVSQILDDPDVPEFVLDYVLYHEVLHILHPVRMGSGTKRIIHSAAFRRDERKYPRWKEGEEWITRLARSHRRARRRAR